MSRLTMDIFHSSAFGAYTLFATTLSIVLVSIDMFGVALLPREKEPDSPPNEAMPPLPSAGTRAPEGPALVMAAHRNALANIVPFVLVMLLYVSLGASEQWVIGLCAVFLTMRIAHPFLHVRKLQPWRFIAWIMGQMCFFVACFQVIRAALARV